MSPRKEEILNRLHKGLDRTTAFFSALTPAQWELVLYQEPYPWTVRDLLAHFVSAEELLLQVAQNIAAGGRGAPEGSDYNAINAQEQQRLAGIPPQELLPTLVADRQATIAWTEALSEEDLDRMGYHPALGNITIETFLTAIYGHQLMHMRDLMQLLNLAEK